MTVGLTHKSDNYSKIKLLELINRLIETPKEKHVDYGTGA